MLESWTSKATDIYHVTGITVDGKRFRIVTPNWYHAAGINLYRGSRWLVRNNKRTLISRCYN